MLKALKILVGLPLALAVLATLPFLAACQGARPLAVTGHLETLPTEHRPNINIVAMDSGLTGILNKSLRVARQQTSWSPDGRLKISVEFENRTHGPLRLQVQTAFKDANDNFLPDQTPWKVVVLPRNTTGLYEATALDRQADKAHVRVRRALSE